MGFRVLLHVVRRPSSAACCREKKAKWAAFFFLRCSFVRSMGFVGRPRPSSKLVGPRTARPSSSISFREGLLSRAGGRGRMWVRVGVAPRPRLHRPSHSCSAMRLCESGLQLTEVTRRISTESTDVPAPWGPPSTKRTKEQKPPRKLGTWTVEAYRTWKPRTGQFHAAKGSIRAFRRSTSACPRLSPPARSLFLDARPIATRKKKGQKKGRHLFPRAPIDPPPLFRCT